MLFALAVAALPGLASAQAITEFAIPTNNSQPFSIAVGPDGNLWFTERGANKIGRITPLGVFTEFAVPTAASSPRGITSGPDGNLWFTEEDGNKIGRITTAGVVTEFPVPTAGSQPVGITTGPDNNLWFTEAHTDKVGRITTAGVITEFPVLTASSGPNEITVGPDANLWFTEIDAAKIAQITTAGVVTEFPAPTAGSFPRGITTGSDGNLWFTEEGANKIVRMTTGGVSTEFTIPTGSTKPFLIAAGPDGNLWFTEENGHSIGRITTSGVITEFPIPSTPVFHRGITTGPDGNLWWCERGNNKIGRITPGPLTPKALVVDSAGNKVIEPGETVLVVPSWKNTDSSDSDPVTGVASNFTGPAGPAYTITDATADYGTIGANATVDCSTATGDCYGLEITAAGRPAAHWDATFDETLSDNTIMTWTLHVGPSFTDVDAGANFYYPFIETIFHHGVTAGCGVAVYCPTDAVTRAQMAVFLLRAKFGSGHTPPACTGTVFLDVPCTGPLAFYAPWIEELASLGITTGCGSGNYCPVDPVNRAQMAVFLLRTKFGSGHVPPACTGTVFLDVSCAGPWAFYAPFIEELAGLGITSGCGSGNYCPDSANTREQMAVFLTRTFELVLYGP